MAAGPEGRNDPVENAAMEAFRQGEYAYENHLIDLITFNHGNVRGVEVYAGVPRVNCGIVTLNHEHEMQCGTERYVALLGGITPFVDDAVIEIYDDYDSENLLLRFNAGVLACTSIVQPG